MSQAEQEEVDVPARMLARALRRFESSHADPENILDSLLIEVNSDSKGVKDAAHALRRHYLGLDEVDDRLTD